MGDRYKCFDATVLDVRDLTPRLKRLTVGGGGLSGFSSDRPGQWVKLFVDESERSGRAFTVRRWDPATLEMDIDIVVHGEGHGVVGPWLRSVAPGSPTRLAGPRSDFSHEPGRELFLFGDETALPAISTIVESLPRSATATVTVEIESETARLAVESQAAVDWTWLVAGRSPGQRLRESCERLRPGCDHAQVWIGCESAAAAAMRTELRAAGFDRKNLHASGYWKRGAPEHVDAQSDY